MTFKLADALYKRLDNDIEEHLKQEQFRVLSEAGATPETFLAVLSKTWLLHCDNMVRLLVFSALSMLIISQTFIRNMLLPLDRKYAITTTGVKSLWDLGLYHFRQKVASHPDIQRKALFGILQQIQAERYTARQPVLLSLASPSRSQKW